MSGGTACIRTDFGVLTANVTQNVTARSKEAKRGQGHAQGQRQRGAHHHHEEGSRHVLMPVAPRMPRALNWGYYAYGVQDPWLRWTQFEP